MPSQEILRGVPTSQPLPGDGFQWVNRDQTITRHPNGHLGFLGTDDKSYILGGDALTKTGFSSKKRKPDAIGEMPPQFRLGGLLHHCVQEICTQLPLGHKDRLASFKFAQELILHGQLPFEQISGSGFKPISDVLQESRLGNYCSDSEFIFRCRGILSHLEPLLIPPNRNIFTVVIPELSLRTQTPHLDRLCDTLTTPATNHDLSINYQSSFWNDRNYSYEHLNLSQTLKLPADKILEIAFQGDLSIITDRWDYWNQLMSTPLDTLLEELATFPEKELVVEYGRSDPELLLSHWLLAAAWAESFTFPAGIVGPQKPSAAYLHRRISNLQWQQILANSHNHILAPQASGRVDLLIAHLRNQGDAIGLIDEAIDHTDQRGCYLFSDYTDGRHWAKLVRTGDLVLHQVELKTTNGNFGDKQIAKWQQECIYYCALFELIYRMHEASMVDEGITQSLGNVNSLLLVSGSHQTKQYRINELHRVPNLVNEIIETSPACLAAHLTSRSIM